MNVQFMSGVQLLLRRLSVDPRNYQITILLSLLVLGLWQFGFDLAWWQVLACPAGALLAQSAACRWYQVRFDIRSPLISGLSLVLLLRTDAVMLAFLAGGLAVASKFMLRWGNKHIFNPANFSLVVMSLLSTHVWISAGQWGTVPLLTVTLAGMGYLVTARAKSLDVSLALLSVYGLLLLGRGLWLGDPIHIPMHQLQNGALLVFAFFMISDPKTIPNARTARLVFACCVACMAFILQFVFYQASAVVYALIFVAPFVVLLDRIWPAKAYQWPNQLSESREKFYET